VHSEADGWLVCGRGGFGFALVEDAVALGGLEELWVGFVGVDFGDGEDLFADLGAVECGGEIEAQLGAVAELADGGHGRVVAEDARVKGGGVAIGVDGHIAEVGRAEVLVQEAAVAARERAGLEAVGVVVGETLDRFLEFADFLAHEAGVELVGDRVVDLDRGHLRGNIAALRREAPALHVDAAFAVAHDGPVIGHGEGAAGAEGLDPLGVEGEREGCVGEVGDIDAFEYAAATAVGPGGRVGALCVGALCVGEREAGEREAGEDEGAAAEGLQPGHIGLAGSIRQRIACAGAHFFRGEVPWRRGVVRAGTGSLRLQSGRRI
jgi:hypothetical protein